ncbi:MAG: hypothetical protein AABY32_04540 [Nanoarchaeota archaeon]
MKIKEKRKIQNTIRNFEKLKEIHKEKIEKEKRNYAVVNYWEKQIKRFDEEIKKSKKKINGTM